MDVRPGDVPVLRPVLRRGHPLVRRDPADPGRAGGLLAAPQRGPAENGLHGWWDRARARHGRLLHRALARRLVLPRVDGVDARRDLAVPALLDVALTYRMGGDR